MRVSGEARILNNILPRHKILYDKGGALIIQLFENSFLDYLFLGRRYTGLTGELYYISIAVKEYREEINVNGYVRVFFRKGLFGIGSKTVIDGYGVLKRIVEDIIASRKELVHRNVYEEIVVKKTDKVGEEIVDKELKGEAVVVIGRTSIVHSIRVKRFFENLYVFNNILLEEIARSLHR